MVRSGVVSVYIKDITPRVGWIFKLIFEDLLGQSLVLTNDASIFTTDEIPALNYSTDTLPGIPTITPAALLFEDDIREQQILLTEYQGLPVFFQTEGGNLPFDPFSMAFYLVSRYEEHLPFSPDDHGRFSYTSGLAYREGFLDVALVNRLAILLKDLLMEHFPDAWFKEKEYEFIPTIDVDIAYAHLGKGFIRTYGAMAKLLLKGDIREIRSRLRTMRGHAKDPYDNFDLINIVCKENELHPLYFILAGNPGPHDRNLSTRNEKFSRLMKELAGHSELGVHPSYASDNDPEKLQKELERIQSVTGKPIAKSRQHYVRLKFPGTYNMLINCSIKDDYSMGYADKSGFRASIASAYKYFDLKEGKETDLRVHPFMFMDTTLSDYLGLSPDQYAEEVMPIIEEVKYCKGTLTAIWHNYAMADNDRKHKAFKELIKLAAKK